MFKNQFYSIGVDHGFLRRVELMIGRPLMWLICLFHMLELIFRALFFAIDGKSSGPESYKGPIGKQISNNDESWKTKNKTIRFKEARKGMVKQVESGRYQNTDDNVLYQLAMLIQNGPDSQFKDAINLTPGKTSLSRWTTAEAGILYLFVITEDPSDNLILLVDIIINCIAPLR